MDTTTVTLIGAVIVAVIAAIPGILAASNAKAALDATKETRTAIDGRLTVLLEAVKAASFQEGSAAGAAEERTRAAEEAARVMAASDASAAEARRLVDQQAAAVAAPVPAPVPVIHLQGAIKGEVTDPGSGKVTGQLDAEMGPTGEG